MISLQEVGLERMHTALIAQRVLKAMPVKSHASLAFLDAREQEFDFLKFSWCSERATAHRGKHLRDSVVVRDCHLWGMKQQHAANKLRWRIAWEWAGRNGALNRWPLAA